MAAHLVGCIRLLRARPPWRDRRGRPPVRPGNVFGFAAIAVGIAVSVSYLLADGLQDTLPHRSVRLGSRGLDRGRNGCLGAARGGVPGGRSGPGARAIGPWLASAFLMAMPMHLGVVHHPLQGIGLLTWADALQPLIPAIVLLGLLVSQRERSLGHAERPTARPR